MRTITILLTVAMLGFSAACGGNDGDNSSAANTGEDCDLVGSWEMVSMQVTTADSTVEYDETEQPTLKILNDTHWMFIRQSADSFLFSQGGHYELDGNTYKEIVDYSADPGNIGNVYTFECQVENDRWLHRGGLGNVRYDEVWRRVR